MLEHPRKVPLAVGRILDPGHAIVLYERVEDCIDRVRALLLPPRRKERLPPITATACSRGLSG